MNICVIGNNLTSLVLSKALVNKQINITIFYNYKKNKFCALKLLKKEKIFIFQWLCIGIASLLISYSYLYLNASEATAAKRALEMFWAIIAWFILFKEKHIIKKLLFAFMIILWLIIMVL